MNWKFRKSTKKLLWLPENAFKQTSEGAGMCGSRWRQLPAGHPDGGRRLVSPKMTAAVTVTPLTNPSAWSTAQTGREINDDADGQVQSARGGRSNTDISGKTSEGPCHRNADRTSAAVEDGAAPAAADAAGLNAARIKRRRAAPTDERAFADGRQILTSWSPADRQSQTDASHHSEA